MIVNADSECGIADADLIAVLQGNGILHPDAVPQRAKSASTVVEPHAMRTVVDLTMDRLHRGILQEDLGVIRTAQADCPRRAKVRLDQLSGLLGREELKPEGTRHARSPQRPASLR